MSLATDLIEQAEHLATRELTRPRQASLRRSVSSAYYALFHLLTNAAATLVAPNVSDDVNHRIQCWLDHGEMKRICGRFLPTQLTGPLLDLIGASASTDMQLVARTLVQLQDARHSADYDLSWSVTRGEALRFVASARDAFDSWDRIHDGAEANIFSSHC